jgi:hypothetical protein
MRRPFSPRAVLALTVLGALAAGCGTNFEMPTEHRGGRGIPADKSYQVVSAWTPDGQNPFDRVQDILVTQRFGSQLFILFGRPLPDPSSEATAAVYPMTQKEPIAGTGFLHLHNAVALAAGGDGAGGRLNRIYALDRGDTCQARVRPDTVYACSLDVEGAPPPPGLPRPPVWDRRVTNLSIYPRVREYGLLGGDTISTFADTTMADVRGIAADYQGQVYVAGTAIILEPDVSNPRIRTRQFESRIYRYIRGPRYAGINPPDRTLPGANWHRDSTWQVIEGSGVGSLQNPHRIDWMLTPNGSRLYASDFNKNWIQVLSDQQSSTGYFALDGAATGTFFYQADDVAADEQGFIYVCDTGNRRVLRYGADDPFIQRVDISDVGGTGPLVRPVAIAANDTLVFIADPGYPAVFKMRRRP